ncbi:MAG: enoyl-CoA hydratase/isomerase family protein [Deltaproteobacteria bacterium]|nr:enoyl-CoA hydratase/isomerase family protein [Deltaproteobacteria bacterium]
MSSDQLLVEKEGHILTLVLNRPEKRNALTPDMLVMLHDVLQQSKTEDDTRAVIIRGAGDRAFSSGYDVSAIPTRVSPELKNQLRGKSPFDLALDTLVNYPYPVIAMLNGYAFGGACDLAVACDLRIAAEDVQMGMVPARLGLVYFPDGIQRFIRTIGWANTREMFFTARRYRTGRLKEMGLVNYVVPRKELETFTHELAGEIAVNAPLSLKGMKRIMNLIASSQNLDSASLEETRTLVEAAMTSQDLQEGQAAFLEKRKPVFKGK